MNSSPDSTFAVNPSRLLIVMACDESYAMPLAVAARSMAQTSHRGDGIDLVILTDRFSQQVRARVEASVPSGRIQFHWLPIDLSQFQGFSLLAHISRMTYARLLLPWVLPAETKRVLYLDADIVVLDDLRSLWEADLGGAALGAVTDMDAAENAARLELPANAYFNAGVLLIDLARWKEQQLSERSIRYMQENPHAPFSDQDALNAVSAGHWRALPERWNLQKRDHGANPARNGAALVHFCCSGKPWKPGCLSTSAPFYDRYRSQTAFRRDAPTRLRDLLAATLARLRRTARQITFVRRFYERLVKSRAAQLRPASDA